MQVFKVAIVGTGATGLMTLLLLKRLNVPLKDIVLIDPYHDGGDLQRKWASVTSNTTWGQTVEIVKLLGGQPSFPEPWCSLDPEKPTLLQHSISLLRYLCKDLISECEVLYGTCQTLKEEGDSVSVTVALVTQETIQVVATACVLSIGATPKQENLPLPTIPLEIALDKVKLATYVSTSSKVLLFGTSHSGTLILRNLQSLGIQHAAVYKGKAPFFFARDGHYDGVKQESEQIADDILSGKYTNTTLLPITNTAQLIRWSKKADWVIYATGFQRRTLQVSFDYDTQTGRLLGYHRVWGFGIGFPKQAPDGVHFDVSLPAFYSHLATQVPSLVESFYG